MPAPDRTPEPLAAESTAQTAPRRRALRELGAAPVAGALFLARAWAAIPVVELSLRLLGERRTIDWIEAVPARRATADSARGSGDPSVFLGERLVAAAYRAHPLAGTCLPRSLVQYLLHRRDGTPARFVVGVRRPDRGPNDRPGPRIEAHAWVEGPDAVPEAAERFARILESSDIDRAPA